MKANVTVVIPARNEEKFIEKCLDSLILQDYPKENLEVLVVDGKSADRTKEITGEYCRKYGFIKLFENPKKYTPISLNIGIKNAKGDIIVRMDAHAIYDNGYISKCVKYLEEYKADNVGGTLKTVPAKNTLAARAIALSLSSVFGAGNSAFRTGVSKPTLVDTVFGGCFRKEIFSKIGLYNENLIRSQDMELNLRLKRAGGKILLAPDIVAVYYPKSTLKDFFLHNVKDGIWSVLPMKFTKMPFSFRHYVPLFFVLGLFGLLALGFLSKLFINLFFIAAVVYIVLSLYFSFKLAIKEKDIRLVFVLPFVFFARHFGYGIGSLWGIIKLLFTKKS